MKSITFADVVHQSISFSEAIPSEAIAIRLIDNPWMQRLRDISQTANTRLVYMFSEHSRFGHSLGVCHLANVLMNHLAKTHADEVEKYRVAVSAAALLHDVGHLAPGSHTAYKTWFPDGPDLHEEVAVRVTQEDPGVRNILELFGSEIPTLVAQILSESTDIPPWAWEVISGGGWNVDRGNWCIVDSILAGVSYGKYNIPALVDAIVMTPDRHIALRENRLDAMMHFTLSRHAMYRQVYQHRVLLAADMINRSVVLRARDLIKESGTFPLYADDAMRAALLAKGPEELSLETTFAMRESWWRYHLFRWTSEGGDAILADLADRLLNRRLFKTIRLRDDDELAVLLERAAEALHGAGLDPRYYLFEIATHDMLSADYRQSMLVSLDDGDVQPLADAEPLFRSLTRESPVAQKAWLALPGEMKSKLGRTR